ncbi:MAG: hypothetical protein RJA70_1796 [Pseudomonadota bacterium]|jgi:D-glycerate 3-kinase
MLSLEPLALQLFDRYSAKLRLPPAFLDGIKTNILPVAQYLSERRNSRPECTLLVGVSGAQGSGKSTASFFLQQLLIEGYGNRVAVLSIDDFYLTRAERLALSEQVHPLLKTRGVPGTHDVELMRKCLTELRGLAAHQDCSWPKFDKARDDRAATADSNQMVGPVDIVLLEGWCVGATAQSADQIVAPLNSLEQNDDPEGGYRRYINEQLAGPYRQMFAELDALVFLKVPSMDCVLSWRRKQEDKLRAERGNEHGVMSDAEVARFVMHYERLTRHLLATLPALADVVIPLEEDHTMREPRFR